MSGTKVGGKRAARTNKLKYGSEFYEVIGRMGGKIGTTGGFHKSVCSCEYKPGEHKKAECAGALGGKISKRGKATYER